MAKKLKDEDMALKGHRDTSMVKMLEKYIPIAATCIISILFTILYNLLNS